MTSELPKIPDEPSGTISEAEADARMARGNFDLKTVVAKADHRLRNGDHRAAAAFYSLSVRIEHERGSGDDSTARLARRATEMVDSLAQRFCDHIRMSILKAGYPVEARPARFQHALEMLLGERQRPLSTERYPQLPKLFYYPGLPYVEFADATAFSWRSGLEGCFPEMRSEAMAILREPEAFSPYVTKVAHRPQADTHGLLENPDWSSFYLWENGKPVKQNAQICPAIFKALTESAPLFDVAGRSPSAYLSLLRPGAHIPAHTGMLNCRYICHLPLIVPPGCRFRVGNSIKEWTEGRLLVFDDTVEHEAWNRSTENRLILLFEVWAPDLSELEKTLIRLLLEAVDTYR